MTKKSNDIKPLVHNLVQNLRAHGENVDYDTNPDYLIGRNMEIMDKEMRSKMGDKEYQKYLGQRYQKWKEEVRNDPTQQKVYVYFTSY